MLDSNTLTVYMWNPEKDNGNHFVSPLNFTCEELKSTQAGGLVEN